MCIIVSVDTCIRGYDSIITNTSTTSYFTIKISTIIYIITIIIDTSTAINLIIIVISDDSMMMAYK